MAAFKRTTKSTLVKHLRAFADQLEKDKTADKELADKFNEWMDDLLGQDFFGTEGQCDPRGDHRD